MLQGASTRIWKCHITSLATRPFSNYLDCNWNHTPSRVSYWHPQNRSIGTHDPPQCSAITVNTTSGYPERAPQLGVRKLSGEFQVLEADSLPRSLIPGEQHGQLEGGDLQVILTHLVLKSDLEIPKKRYFTSFVFNNINWLILIEDKNLSG